MIRFIASYPKSGNTWIRMLLDGYMTGRVDINNVVTSTADQGYMWCQQHSPWPLEKLDMGSWPLVRVGALFSMACHFGNKAVVKTHMINAEVNGVPLFPISLMGPSVYIMRDPRDVCVSYAAHADETIDDTITKMAETKAGWAPDISKMLAHGLYSSWDQHVKSWVKAPKTLVVKYEDLKKDTADVFEGIIKHYEIGGDYSRERVENAVELCRLSRLQAQEKKHGFKESIHGTFFGGERPKLKKKQKHRIEELFGERMKQHGYV